MTGTIINVAAVLAGGAIGTRLGHRLPRKLQETVMNGLGMMVIVLGISMALTSQNLLIVMGSVLVGGLLGEWWRIEDGLEKVATGWRLALAGRRTQLRAVPSRGLL